ncbi:MAG: hypothetical protein CME65_01960 [Halobacteriovoraceae bacterium]|nr:hypothetical protein [Halobacteriovoraceae bacterium]|tara:strand:- start:9513 stop:10715 length:1203 start_codon:yes stop_codon:yes gene_type:complete
MEESFFSSFYLYKEHKTLWLTSPKKAYIQYRNFRINLLSGEKYELGVSDFFEDLDQLNIGQEFEKPIVIHLLFELAYTCLDLEVKSDRNVPLAIYIEYNSVSKREIYSSDLNKINFESLSQVNLADYEERFRQVYENLLDGETYQLNLTQPFYLRPSRVMPPEEFIQFLWQDSLKVGAYAHATYIGTLDILFASNSPECLFQIESNSSTPRILTMPIKGTEKVVNNDFKHSWEELKNSAKNQAELFMISDLMRNDLTKLTGFPARVRHEKFPLQVPGLLHQFSVIDSRMPENLELSKIVKTLFPGGSVTGAPKKNTLRLIERLEGYRRGFYCGSTILLYQDRKTASINIRSAEVNYGSNEIKYGAGGGITLQSQMDQEFEETLNKLKSFLILFELKKTYN